MQSEANGAYSASVLHDGGDYWPGMTFADGGPPALLGNPIVFRLPSHEWYPLRPDDGGLDDDVLCTGTLRRVYWGQTYMAPNGEPELCMGVRCFQEKVDFEPVIGAVLPDNSSAVTEYYADGIPASWCVGTAEVLQPAGSRLKFGTRLD
jgi:hypothetical protein